MRDQDITSVIIGAAIEIHEILGPGLLESAYEHSLLFELALRGLTCVRQLEVPLHYKSLELRGSYRVDLIVANIVIVEVKSIASIQPVHVKQVLTYLRLTGLSVGLILNFNVPVMKAGIKRVGRNSATS